MPNSPVPPSKFEVIEGPKDEYGIALLSSELLFAMLPFAVVFLIFAYQQKGWISYLMAPEWAFASALLFGQAIVKLVQGIVHIGPGVNIGAVCLLISILIVVCLVPSLILLALILTATHLPIWMGIAQVSLAIISAVVYMGFGSIAHAITHA